MFSGLAGTCKGVNQIDKARLLNEAIIKIRFFKFDLHDFSRIWILLLQKKFL